MQIITTAIIKGGTGKSTTAAALVQAAVKKRKRVLAIDLDPQANLSEMLDGDTDAAGSYDILHGTKAADVIQHTKQGADVITASSDLATEKTSGGSAKRLEQAIEPLKGNYDFIFIDTPPQMGELTYNALQASTGLLIPLEADISSINGLYQVAEIAAEMRKRTATNLSIIGVLITRYRSRAKINQYMEGEIVKAAKEINAPYLGAVRDGIAIREAQSLRKSVFEYAPKSNPAQDYMKLFEKIQRRK